MQDGQRSPQAYEEYTVAVVCAIELEISAIRYILDIEHRSLLTKEGDFNIYILGVLKGHNVRFLVSISNRVPSNKHDIRLGNIIVSMPEGQYSSIVYFVLKGFLSPLLLLLRGAIMKMQSNHLISENKAEELRHEFKGPEIHYGLIASSDRIIRNTAKRSEQHYAAITTAACTKELLSYIDPEVASAVPVPSIDAASNQDNRLATRHIFHSKRVQNSGSGNFSVSKDLNIS
ncbi:pfs domain-containing protein [Dactylonectria macrodidyma]|uniref:Pfs domain-containing protein n=1 Tax=Dactylonectria macrodidyma TaxID=307937 RepID=A0A9P9J740_9HYPO|nr:pfs domain-containing protein [Dactylonectria macrodidyma]